MPLTFKQAELERLKGLLKIFFELMVKNENVYDRINFDWAFMCIVDREGGV